MPLIKARPGVYGRQATPEEQKRFKAFAKRFVKQQKQIKKEQAAFLTRIREFIEEHGRFPTSAEIFC